MVYAIAIFPKGCAQLEKIREIYDHRQKNIPAHITLVFPFPDSAMTKTEFVKHATKICNKSNSFNITTSTTTISWDNAVLLRVNRGKDNVIALHDALYSGPLRKHLAKINYLPHITLGIFSNKKGAQTMRKKYPAVKTESLVEETVLLKVNTSEKFITTSGPKIVWSRKIKLSESSL